MELELPRIFVSEESWNTCRYLGMAVRDDTVLPVYRLMQDMGNVWQDFWTNLKISPEGYILVKVIILSLACRNL